VEVVARDWNETEMRARELLVLLAGAPELIRQMPATLARAEGPTEGPTHKEGT
jgi:uncharacterized protein (DUF736 family)